MSEKDRILGRIREALSVSAPVPGAHGGGDGHTPSEPEALKTISQWLPAVGGTFEEWIALFARNSEELKTDFHLLGSREELPARLGALAEDEGWRRIAAHTTPLTDHALGGVSLPILRTDDPFDMTELERCDAGVTGCDALVAQTGSVVVSNRSAGGRALSVVPPHHVVVAEREKLVADLSAGFAVLRSNYGASFPSFMSFITGPSRTGDIERILVLGAHGPKKLTIFCV
jgi:L-lactate dehydrogenase complex protein LldG